LALRRRDGFRNGGLHRMNVENAASLAWLRPWDSWGVRSVGAFDGIASRKSPSWMRFMACASTRTTSL
jgi:hypothetical protein